MSTLMDMRNSHRASIGMGLHSQFRTRSCTHRPATHSGNDVMYMYAKSVDLEGLQMHLAHSYTTTWH